MTERERFEAYLVTVDHPRIDDARKAWRRAADAMPDLPPPQAGANDEGAYHFDWHYTYTPGRTLSLTFPAAGGCDWFYRDKDLGVVIGTEEDADPAVPEEAFALLRGFALGNAGEERDVARLARRAWKNVATAFWRSHRLRGAACYGLDVYADMAKRRLPKLERAEAEVARLTEENGRLKKELADATRPVAVPWLSPEEVERG